MCLGKTEQNSRKIGIVIASLEEIALHSFHKIQRVIDTYYCIGCESIRYVF